MPKKKRKNNLKSSKRLFCRNVVHKQVRIFQQKNVFEKKVRFLTKVRVIQKYGSIYQKN